VSAVPWIAGALTHGTARRVLWTLAVAVDYTAYALRFPTPGLGRAPTSAWPTVAEHLAERYRQFFIIALGELILVTGLALSGTGFAPDRTAAFLVSIATTVLLWRIYIYRAGELLSAAIGHTPPAWIAVTLGGPALFLAGRALFEYEVFSRVSRDRPIGVLVLAALAPAMLLAPPMLVALVPTLVLAGIAVADATRARGRPAEPASPPRGRS
jgi:low temperature requirement protein LtrA